MENVETDKAYALMKWAGFDPDSNYLHLDCDYGSYTIAYFNPQGDEGRGQIVVEHGVLLTAIQELAATGEDIIGQDVRFPDDLYDCSDGFMAEFLAEFKGHLEAGWYYRFNSDQIQLLNEFVRNTYIASVLQEGSNCKHRLSSLGLL